MNTLYEDLPLDMYEDEVKPELEAPAAISPTEIPVLNWEDENFSWATIDDLFQGVIPELDPVANISESGQAININADIPSPSVNDENGNVVDLNRSLHSELMTKYGLSDDHLSDMTLKQLRRCCSLNDHDYKVLKSYRRTCLNRGYARSSRSKQQEKAFDLTAQLQEAQEKVKQLQKEVEDKNLRIQYLELENRLLLDFNKNE